MKECQRRTGDWKYNQGYVRSCYSSCSEYYFPCIASTVGIRWLDDWKRTLMPFLMMKLAKTDLQQNVLRALEMIGSHKMT